jgi:hypothetical protein
MVMLVNMNLMDKVKAKVIAIVTAIAMAPPSSPSPRQLRGACFPDYALRNRGSGNPLTTGQHNHLSAHSSAPALEMPSSVRDDARWAEFRAHALTR